MRHQLLHGPGKPPRRRNRRRLKRDMRLWFSPTKPGSVAPAAILLMMRPFVEQVTGPLQPSGMTFEGRKMADADMQALIFNLT
jgi:hypothetical protein